MTPDRIEKACKEIREIQKQDYGKEVKSLTKEKVLKICEKHRVKSRYIRELMHLKWM